MTEWNSKLPDNYVYAIAIDGGGNKWIGTLEGLAKFDGVNWTVYNTSNSGLPDNYVGAIAIDGRGNKWIGTDMEGLQSLMELIGLFITLQTPVCLITVLVQ
jgi:ligand-binding sensor domain-containing protein